VFALAHRAAQLVRLFQREPIGRRRAWRPPAEMSRVAGGPYGTSRPLRTGLACFPGIRLKPFKGVSDDTRSCDSGPKAVNLPMAIGMKQNEVVEPVTAATHAPDDVVGMPSSLDAYWLSTVRTSASLSLP
jgi:hypothetical protein